MNKLDIFKVVILVLVLPISTKIFTIDFSVVLVMIVLWFLLFRFKAKIAWLVLLILIIINLQINRLLYFDLDSLKISFDFEQSFFKYPGIGESITRYKQEGLWLPFFFRNIFYSSYLIVFSLIGSFLKLMSPLFWVKILGFSGFSLMISGIIHFFKKNNKNYIFIWWFLLVIITSSLRVLGDNQIAVFLNLPVVIYWFYLGFKSNLFKKYYIYWYLLFVIDLLLR